MCRVWEVGGRDGGLGAGQRGGRLARHARPARHAHPARHARPARRLGGQGGAPGRSLPR